MNVAPFTVQYLALWHGHAAAAHLASISRFKLGPDQKGLKDAFPGYNSVPGFDYLLWLDHGICLSGHAWNLLLLVALVYKSD